MTKAVFGDYSIVVEERETNVSSSVKVFFKDSLLYVVDDFAEEDVQALISAMMLRKSHNHLHGLIPSLPLTDIYTKYTKISTDYLWSVNIGSTNYANTLREVLGGIGDAPIKHHNNVYIALPQENISLDVIERIQNACGELMEALGYELEIAEEPVLGSFYQRLKFILTSPKTKQEVEDGFKKAKSALEARYLNLPTAEATEKLALATSNLINSLNSVDESVLRIGGILVVKVKKEGGTRIFAETLSPEVSLLLDKNPQIMSDPNTVYNLLQSMMNQNYFTGDESINIKQVGS